MLKHEILEVSHKIVRKRHEELEGAKLVDDEIIDITVSYDGTW